MIDMGIRYAFRCLLAAFLLLGAIQSHAQTNCAANAAVTLTGSLRSANGIPAVNDVISFAPTNTGYIAGCGVNIASTFNCATSSDGSVVLLQNPLVATTATPQYGSGSVPSGTYYVEYTFYDGNSHETLPSPEFTVSLTSAGTINVNAPSGGLQSSAVGMKVYIGTSSGTETYQGLTTGTASFAQSSALASSSAAPPTANSTICQVTANDAMWPVGTGYMVTLTDASGNQVPRFSQQWQLNGAGSTVNLSAGVPWYHGVVYYPSPIVSAPTNHGQQGISGPLGMNGYNLTNVGRLGIGTAFPAYPLHVVGDFNLQLGALRMNGVGGTLGQCLLSSGSSTLPTWGSCLSSTAVYYQAVKSNGTTFTPRPILSFSSAFTVTDDSGGSDTKADLAVQSGLTAGTYNQVTVNGQGIVTAGAVTSGLQVVTGTIDSGSGVSACYSIPVATQVLTFSFPAGILGCTVATNLPSGGTSDFWYQTITPSGNSITVQRVCNHNDAGVEGIFSASTQPVVMCLGH